MPKSTLLLLLSALYSMQKFQCGINDLKSKHVISLCQKLDMLFHFVVRFLIFWPFIVGMSLSFFLSTLFRFLFFFFLSSLGDIYSSFFVFLCKNLIRNIGRQCFHKKTNWCLLKAISLARTMRQTDDSAFYPHITSCSS